MKKITNLTQFRKSKRKNQIIILSFQIGIFALFFIQWELLGCLGIINVFLFSKPSNIWLLFINMLSNSLMQHVLISTLETILGLLIGTISGLILSTILYMFPTANKIFDPFLTVLNALPKTALGPLIIIILGTSFKGIIGVSISLIIIITIMNSLSFFNSIDVNIIKMMKTLKANKLQILTKVVYPLNTQNFLTLIKVNIGLAWIGTIVGEFLVSKEGIGYLVVYGGQVFKMDLVMLGVILLSIVALLMYGFVTVIEYCIKKRKH